MLGETSLYQTVEDLILKILCLMCSCKISQGLNCSIGKEVEEILVISLLLKVCLILVSEAAAREDPSADARG